MDDKHIYMHEPQEWLHRNSQLLMVTPVDHACIMVDELAICLHWILVWQTDNAEALLGNRYRALSPYNRKVQKGDPQWDFKAVSKGVSRGIII